MTSDVTPQFPQYPAPEGPGPTVADRKQAGPLNKLIGKMLPKRALPRPRGKRIQSDQNVHIKHAKKIKYY
jgi:hypothetical protein